MSIIGVIFLVVFVIICILLVCLVLVQSEEGGGMGGLFGDASSKAFGSRSGNVLTKTTYTLVTLFFVTTFILAFLNRAPAAKQLDTSVLDIQTTPQAGRSWLDEDAVESDVSVPEEPVSQAAVNEAFEAVYSAYENDIVLDGASDYVVKSGDTLSAITLASYGSDNGFFFPLIMLASNDVVLDPDLIQPGMNLTIPNLQQNLNDPDARQRIKSFLLDIAVVYDRKTRPETSRELRELANSARLEEGE